METEVANAHDEALVNQSRCDISLSKAPIGFNIVVRTPIQIRSAPALRKQVNRRDRARARVSIAHVQYREPARRGEFLVTSTAVFQHRNCDYTVVKYNPVSCAVVSHSQTPGLVWPSKRLLRCSPESVIASSPSPSVL